MMKLATVLHLLFFAAGAVLSAQEFSFDIDTLVYSGTTENRINLVILGDGYQEHELDKFLDDSQIFLGKFFATTPVREYRSYFNVIAIKVISEESGASHPGTANDEFPLANHPVKTVNNFFGSTFDYAGIHRLLVATNSFRISSVLASHFPEYDQAIILVNSPYYGGAGGQFPTASTDASSANVAIHELGHSFAGLSDEYWAGNQYARENINMTQVTDPASVRWNRWMDAEGVGVYQHCCGGNSAQWYKPYTSCKMQVSLMEFCPVCVEAFVEEFHFLVTPLEGHRPVEAVVEENMFPRTFALDLLHPDPSTLKTVWNLNGSVLAEDVDSVQLTGKELEEGNNRLVVSIYDETSFTRSEIHSDLHRYSVTWTIAYSSEASVITSARRAFHLQTFPNPSSGQFLIEYQLDEASRVALHLMDVSGNVLQKGDAQLQEAGRHSVHLDLDQYPDGAYMLEIEVDGISYHHKILKT